MTLTISLTLIIQEFQQLTEPEHARCLPQLTAEVPLLLLPAPAVSQFYLSNLHSTLMPQALCFNQPLALVLQPNPTAVTLCQPDLVILTLSSQAQLLTTVYLPVLTLQPIAVHHAPTRPLSPIPAPNPPQSLSLGGAHESGSLQNP